MKIEFPNRNGESVTENLEVNGNIVIVGANGSGKSRMGVWIDQKNSEDLFVYRISAHRALQIPNTVPLKNLSTAEDDFLYGRQMNPGSSEVIKFQTKYGGQPAIHLQNDFQNVLSTLFAKAARRNEDYIDSCKTNKSQLQLPIPSSVIDDLLGIWNNLLPHRTIKLDDYKVMVSNFDSNYHGKEMSDGERVSLYLIASCLCVRENSLIIVDEPELHIHKVLMSKLWTQIEEKRSDCKFIYITHDLDFAVTRTNAKKIWAKEHDGKDKWIWEEVPEKENIPEELMLQILGSRKSVLFVEGERGKSLDFPIYEAVYPEFTIIPRSSCSKVIEGTKAMLDNKTLHSIRVFGLIDRDYRPDNELKELINYCIYHIELGEVENLLCIPDVIRVVADHQGYNDYEVPTIIEKCKNKMFEIFQQNKEEQIYKRTAYIIRNSLKKLKDKGSSFSELEEEYKALTSSINIEQEYAKNQEQYDKILEVKDEINLLRFYTNKGLASNFNFIIPDYRNLVIRLLQTNKKEQIVKIWKLYLPIITLN